MMKKMMCLTNLLTAARFSVFLLYLNTFEKKFGELCTICQYFLLKSFLK